MWHPHLPLINTFLQAETPSFHEMTLLFHHHLQMRLMYHKILDLTKIHLINFTFASIRMYVHTYIQTNTVIQDI